MWACKKYEKMLWCWQMHCQPHLGVTRKCARGGGKGAQAPQRLSALSDHTACMGHEEELHELACFGIRSSMLRKLRPTVECHLVRGKSSAAPVNPEHHLINTFPHCPNQSCWCTPFCTSIHSASKVTLSVQAPPPGTRLACLMYCREARQNPPWPP